jgi:hypothetical protein
MEPQHLGSIPLTTLNPYETHRAMVALVQLLGALGPFDSFTCSLRYSGGDGWTSAFITHHEHDRSTTADYVISGELTTDPVSAWLTAQNAYALSWHQPSLFQQS